MTVVYRLRWLMAALIVGLIAFGMLPSTNAQGPSGATGSSAPRDSAQRTEQLPAVQLAPNVASLPAGSLQGITFILEAEPNNSSAEAQPIQSGSTIRANIGAAGDFDWFVFTAGAGDRVYAATMTAFSNSGSGDTELRVIAADGTTVIELDDENGTFNPNSSSIAGATLPTAGTYYLLVNRWNGTGAITPYHLHFTLESGAPVAETEPNSEGQPLPASGWVSGVVSAGTPADTDLYTFDLNAGDSVFLSLDNDPERDATDFNGRLGFGPLDNFILVANDAGTADAIPSEAFFHTVKESGTYYAYVDATAGAGTAATYTLSVTVYPASPQACQVVTYSGPTLPIGPDASVVTATLTAPQTGIIEDLNVTLQLTHTWIPDINITLIAPTGQSTPLFTGIGSNQRTVMNLGLDDEAAMPITTFGAAQGSIWQPEQPGRLSTFDGLNDGGVWQLRIQDTFTGDGGTFQSFALEFCNELSGATPTPSPTNTPQPTATNTPTNTPVATATATATTTPPQGTRYCSTAPTVAVPDGNPTGLSQTITVPDSIIISDANVVVTATHSWVGDYTIRIAHGADDVLFYDRPGVPASTFGCSGDNLPGIVADDEGAAGSLENSCTNTTPAYTPGGHYTPNNPLSVFDGDNAIGTWTLTIADNAAGDTGQLQGWCIEVDGQQGPTPTPTLTPSPTTVPGAPEINVSPMSYEETLPPGQTAQDVMTIQNTGNAQLDWSIIEDGSRPWSNPNPLAPRDANVPTQRLGIATGSATAKVEAGAIVADGSFETGSPNAEWEEFSATFGTPLCTVTGCGQGGGTGPRTGTWWVWFGGTTTAETGAVTQTVTIPSGSAELSFWLEIPAIATANNGFLSVRMDGTEVFRAEENTTGYGTYAEVTVDVSAYAGGDAELSFFSQTDAGTTDVTNFFVDDVAITVTGGGGCPAAVNIPWLSVSPTSGNTAGGGSSAVTLTYDSTGLATGTYTGDLCIESNDADEATVTVPVTLNVQPVTAIDLSSFESPMAGINPADLAAAGILLLAGAALVLRRR